MTGSDGRSWTVRRQWTGRAPRWRSAPSARVWDLLLEAAGAAGEHPALAVVVALAFVLLAVGLAVPLVLFLAELAWLLLAVAGVAVTKLLFRRPWLVVATPHDARESGVVRSAVGWRRSGELVHSLAREIEAGVLPVAPRT